MFRSLSRTAGKPVQLTINGTEYSVPAGSSVWAAMALAGETTTRISPVTEQPRSAYCAMGVCYECLVRIDGQPNQQACLTQVRNGMSVEFQSVTENTQAPLAYPASSSAQTGDMDRD